MAISPALIMFCDGLIKYYISSDREQLPWYATPGWLIALGLILVLVFGKDVLPLPGPVKSFLSAMEEGGMPLVAVLGFLAVIPSLGSALSPYGTEIVTSILPLFQSGLAHAQDTAAAAGSSTSLAATLGGILAAMAGTVIYWVVWCVSNTVTVLCIIAPSMAVPVLKAFRLGVLSILYGLAALHPALGLAAALLIIVLSLMVVRWAFRFSIWGFLLAFDLLRRGWRKPPTGTRILAFGAGDAPVSLGIPKRTIGYLFKADNRLVFRYRRFLLFPVECVVPSQNLIVGSCLLTPVLASMDEMGYLSEMFTFSVRYRSHETYLAEFSGAEGVRDMGILKRAAGVLSWFKNLWKNKNAAECFAK